ncbi:MAG TPA: hypothetical protein DCM05_07925 [Elusimicrobia bacterium]|nr:hypothetical protein [Elusimicrobiota bacterium]
MRYEEIPKEQLIDALAETHRRLREMESRLDQFKEEVRWLEDSLKKRTRELNERVKELDCLYGVSKLLENPDATLEELLRRASDILPKALQYPDIAYARILLRGKEYRTLNYRETPWRQSCRIVSRGRDIGRLEVGYLQEMPMKDEGPFLKEERSLIEAVSKRLAEIAEFKEAAGDVARFMGRLDDLRPNPSAEKP